MSDDLALVAELLWQRNRIDRRIAEIIRRPMGSGHLGEWIAARVFDRHPNYILAAYMASGT